MVQDINDSLLSFETSIDLNLLSGSTDFDERIKDVDIFDKHV